MRLGRAVLILTGVGLAALVGGVGVGIQLENRDSFCASCHTEPETLYYNRTLATPIDLASAHGGTEPRVRCIDCHSGEGIAGRALSLGQGAGDLLAYLLGNYTSPAETSNPVGDQGCTKCHIPVEREGAGAETTGTIASRSHYHFAEYLNEWWTRIPSPAGTCFACHPSHLGAGATQLDIPTTNTSDACDNCHTALSGWRPEDN